MLFCEFYFVYIEELYFVYGYFIFRIENLFCAYENFGLYFALAGHRKKVMVTFKFPSQDKQAKKVVWLNLRERHYINQPNNLNIVPEIRVRSLRISIDYGKIFTMHVLL